MSQIIKRIKWIDIAKAITIFLVVFGHTIRGGIVQHIVYSFHVTTFFLLTGLTFKAYDLRLRLKNDFLRIMIPYYVWGIISIGVYVLMGKFAGSRLNMHVDLLSMVDNIKLLLYATATQNRLPFNSPLWFLPCLFVTKLFFYILNKIAKENDDKVFLISVIIFVLGCIYTKVDLPNLPFSIEIAMKMLLFLAIGKKLYKSKLLYKKNNKLAIFLGILLLIATSAIAVFSPKINYSNDDFPNFILFLITGILGSIAICLISIGIRKCKILEYIGRNTMTILVMHKFPVVFFQIVGPYSDVLNSNESIFAVNMGGMIVSVISIIMCLLVDRFLKDIIIFINKMAGKKESRL